MGKFQKRFNTKKDAIEARNKFIIDNKLEHEYKVQEYKGD